MHAYNDVPGKSKHTSQVTIDGRNVQQVTLGSLAPVATMFIPENDDEVSLKLNQFIER